MASIKFKEAAKAAATRPELRRMFEALGESVSIQDIKSGDASKSRPYVNEIAWALYSAYQSIVMFAVIKLHMLKAGLDMPEYLSRDSVEKLIAVALPHQTEVITKYGDGVYHYLLDELETRLLEELRNMLRGAESDKYRLN